MNRRDTLFALLLLGSAAYTLRVSAETRRSERPYRIGLLPDLSPEALAWFSEAMKKLGWAENRDFTFVQSGMKIGPRDRPIPTRMVMSQSQFRQEEISPSTKRLVESNPDLILATSTAYAVAAHSASKTIPVVMWTGGYPVEAGIANSLARPGKNVTGTSIYAGTGIWGKLVELLRDTKPAIKRVGVLWDYTPPAFPSDEMEQCLREFRNAERILGLKIHVAELASPDQLPSALAALDLERPDALVVTSGWSLLEVRQRIMDYAVEKRLPVIVDFRWRSFVDPYPLLVYGASQPDLMQNAVRYVVQILQGAKPGDLPVLQPTRFELLINLKTAKALGLTVPQSVLMRANEVIE